MSSKSVWLSESEFMYDRKDHSDRFEGVNVSSVSTYSHQKSAADMCREIRRIMTEVVDRKIRTALYETRDVARSLSSILILAKTCRSAGLQNKKTVQFFRRIVMVGIAPFMQLYTAEIDFPEDMQFQRAGTVPKIRHSTST